MDDMTLYSPTQVQQRPDFYANTSFEEPYRPPGEDVVLVTFGDDSDDEGTDEDMSEEIGEEIMALTRHFHRQMAIMQAEQVVRTAEVEQRAAAFEAANALFDALQAHLTTRDVVNQSCVNALTDWRNYDDKAHGEFEKHVKNACLASPSDIRSVHIMLWYRPLPRRVMIALSDMSRHYSKEAYLRFELSKAEGYENGAPGQDKDEVYAARRYRKADFGYEEHVCPGGLGDFREHKLLPLTLEIYMANLDVRLVRLNHAKVSEWFGALEFGISMEGQVYRWLGSAILHIADSLPGSMSKHRSELADKYKMNTQVWLSTALHSADAIEAALRASDGDQDKAVGYLRANPDHAYVASIKKIFNLSTANQVVLFDALVKKLRRTLFLIGTRFDIIRPLQNLRERKDELEAELRVVNKNEEGTVVKMRAGIARLTKDIDAALTKGDQVLGERKTWDWMAHE